MAVIFHRIQAVPITALQTIFYPFVTGIKYMVKNTEMLDRDEVKQIENKLELCRNQENNPNSEK